MSLDLLIISVSFFTIALILVFSTLFKENKTIKELRRELSECRYDNVRLKSLHALDQDILDESKYTPIKVEYHMSDYEMTLHVDEAELLSVVKERMARGLANEIVKSLGNPDKIDKEGVGVGYVYNILVRKR